MGFNLSSLFDSYWKRFLSIFVIVELLSFVAFFHSVFHSVIFFFILLIVFILSLKKLSYGLYALLGELFVGSFGYLFWYDFGSFRLSIRLGIFLVVLAAGGIHTLRKRTCPLPAWKHFKWYVLLLFIVAMGVLNGYLHGYSLQAIFFDMNGYLYLGAMSVFLAVILNKEEIRRIRSLFLAALTSMFLKTLVLLYVFTHQHSKGFISFVYKWVRDTRVGEITDFDYFYRIFFQSHIYFVVFLFAILACTAMILQKKKESIRTFASKYKKTIFILGGFLMVSSFVLIVSYSRSFWVSIMGTGLVFLFALWKFRLLTLKQFFHFSSFSVIFLVLGLVLVSAVVKAPSPFSSEASDFSAISLIEDRADSEGEVALGSRFALLTPLLDTIWDDVLIGSGFGTTVSYQSQDPRAVASSNGGLYETFAFEWGYLDILTEVGIIGLFVYLYFLFLILKQGFSLVKSSDLEVRMISLSLFLGLVVFCLVHIFTPYLNHPLGLGFLMLSCAVFSYFSSYSSQKI